MGDSGAVNTALEKFVKFNYSGLQIFIFVRGGS